MLKQRHERALALALNVGLALGVAGISFESYAAPMQDEDDKEPPKVSIVSPKDGAEVAIGEPLFVRVNATDNVIIKKVHLHMNGTDVGSISGSADTVYSFQVKDIQEGEYTIKSVVYDLAGNSATSEEITVTGVKSKSKEEEKECEKEKSEGDKKKSDEEKGSGEGSGEKSDGDGSNKKSGDEGSNEKGGGEGSGEKSGGGGSKEKGSGEGSGDKSGGDQDEEKSGGDDKGDKPKGNDEPDEKNQPGADTSSKGSSTKQGNDAEPAAKGCTQGSKSLPLWSGLGLLIFGGALRRRQG